MRRNLCAIVKLKPHIAESLREQQLRHTNCWKHTERIRQHANKSVLYVRTTVFVGGLVRWVWLLRVCVSMCLCIFMWCGERCSYKLAVCGVLV